MEARLDDRLPPCDDSLLLRGAAELASMVAAKEVSSREVVGAFLDRIAAVDDQLHAICWPVFDQARLAATAADEAQARGESLGPLHGVPVTIKECFHVAGTPSTMGLTARRDKMEAADGSLVAKLKAAGAIVLGKTNVPQLMILHETDNPLYGRTENPRDLDRTPGGSSGGEGAIIAAYGSPLGLGSDLGGSIRIPAHFCGICGLKPTSHRLTKSGTVENLHGMEALQFQPGPLARRVEDLGLAMRIMADGNEWATNVQVAPAPWREPNSVNLESLRIGVFNDDGYAQPHPAIKRAVDEAAATLRSAGAHVETIRPPDVKQGMALYFGLVGADGASGFRRLAKGSKLDRRIASILRLGGTSRWLRPAMARGLRAQGRHQLADLVLAAGPRSADDYWQLTYEAKQYTTKVLASLAHQRVDAMIFPPHAQTAFAHGEGKPDSLVTASYALIPNLLGIPCGVVPTTTVAASEEKNSQAGLPVGVQVAAGYWREDVVLRVMQVLERQQDTTSK